jgi:two-component system, OmpR family, response regulator
MGRNCKTNIFIVEDNAMYTFFLNEVLKEEGNFNITTFATAEECLNEADVKPDIIILDYFLEGAMTGTEFFSAIQKKYPGINVIVLSGQKNVQVAAELIEAGVSEYIEKKDPEAIQKLKYAILKLSKMHNTGTNGNGHKRPKMNSHDIFIVEDNTAYATALQSFIKNAFPDVNRIKVFPAGEIALMEPEANPGLIILDYFLDDKYYDAKNGLEVIKQLKEKKPNANIVLLSGQSDISVALEATQKYHCHYVQKGEHAFDRIEEYMKELW